MENKYNQSVNPDDKNEVIVSGLFGISDEENNIHGDCKIESNSNTDDNKTLIKSVNFECEGTSFNSISEDYEKLRNNDVTKLATEELKICKEEFDINSKSTIVLPKEEFPSLSLISRNYQDSESDDDSEDSSIDDNINLNDSDDENSIISISSDTVSRDNIKTKGELDIKDLPPIEDLKISLDANKCEPVGCIKNIVDTLVIVETYLHQPALNIDSILFINRGQRALGRIFDVFGPVKKPYYAIRFNNLDHINLFNIKINDLVYFAPQTEYASFIMISKLMQIKGSDASWKHNNEPPPEFLDYSDDETEKLAKRTRKMKKRNKNNSNNINKSIIKPNYINPTDGSSSLPTPYFNRHNHNDVRPFPTYAQQLSSVEFSPHRPPWSYNQMNGPRQNQNSYFMPPRFENRMPPNFANQTPSNFSNQMSPNFGNQMSPNFGNQMSPNFGNQMQPTFDNEMSPNFGNHMQPTFGNQMLPNFGNQRPPRFGYQMPPQVHNQYNMEQMEYHSPNPNYYGNYK